MPYQVAILWFKRVKVRATLPFYLKEILISGEMRAPPGLRESSALSASEGWCRRGTLELRSEEGCTWVAVSPAPPKRGKH